MGVVQSAAGQLVPKEVALPMDQIEDEYGHEHQMDERDADYQFAPDARIGKQARKAVDDHGSCPKARS